jgi:hypothetical protein
MAPKKKPTMLQRQRALRKQQQQTKQQSSRQLPPGKKGGSVTKPGGAMAKSGSAKPTPPRSTAPVERVRVRDLGSTKPKPMAGGSQRALPPGRQGGAMTRVAGAAGKAAAAGRMLPIVGTVLGAASEVSAMADRQKRWDDYKRRTGLDKKTPAQTGGTRAGAAAGTRTRSRNTAKPTSALQGRVGNANVNDLRRGQEEARKAQLERANRGQRSTTKSGAGSTQSRSGGGSSRPSTTRQSSPSSTPKPRFTGSVEEGRKMWAEKYSSSKYDGQAIQKEAKALLKKMKEEKNNQSSAQRAGWDGNKNY